MPNADRSYVEFMDNAARTEFCTAALAVATARNVLTEDDRAAFRADVEAGKVADSEGCGWANLVVYDMSMRCRSFEPSDLTGLIALSRAARF